ISAASALSTVGFQGQPDVVLVAQGLEDGLAGVSAADVAVAFRSLLDTARGKRLEVIVAGPIPQAADPEEASLALTRGPSSVLREASARADVIFSDLGDLSRLIETPPGAKGADQIFPALMQEYQSLLNLLPSQGVMTPTTGMHAEMGRILFQDVMQGAPSVPWKISAAKATLAGQGQLKLEFELANTRRDPLNVTLLPLVPAGLKPKDTNPEIQLAAGAKQTVQLTYAITDTRYLPLTDGEMRLPVLVIAGKQSRIEDIVVPLRPFSITWNARAAFNQEAEFSPELEIENSTGSSLSASWESNWGGKSQEGKIALEADGSEVLKLALPLPAEGRLPLRRVLPLKLALNSNGVRQIFDRDIEITRNMGLKESVPLTAADGPAALRITGKAADGDATVDPIAPWAFGSGYAAVFESKEIQASLSSSAGGGRRLTITLPKSYLYRHEWALGNGNSQLGLNVRFNGGGRDYFLTRSRRQGDDAESLSVLELTDKPTQRWTVRVE
ncbi:MAG: hypothetical protein B7Z16_13365, partial [Algoriphagus sp. 32-45-6]